MRRQFEYLELANGLFMQAERSYNPKILNIFDRNESFLIEIAHKRDVQTGNQFITSVVRLILRVSSAIIG